MLRDDAKLPFGCGKCGMKWFNRLIGRRDSLSGTINLESRDGRDRARAALLKTAYLGGNEAAVQRVLEVGELVWFPTGKRFIERSAQDDEVYFLLTGSVRITVGKTDAGNRDAPVAIGELASILSTKRTASVNAEAGGVNAIRITGSEFRELFDQFEEVKKEFYKQIGKLLFDRLDQMATGNSPKKIPTWLMQILVTLAGMVIGVIVLPSFGFSGWELVSGALCVGIVFVAATILLNLVRLLFMAGLGAGTTAILYMVTGTIDIGFVTDNTFLDGLSTWFSLRRDVSDTRYYFTVMALLAFCYALLTLWYRARDQ